MNKKLNVSIVLLFFIGLFVSAQNVDTNTYPYPRPLPTSGSTPGITIRQSGTINSTIYNGVPTVWDVFTGGGYRSVSNTAERDSIVLSRRKQGMLVYTVDNGHLYQLNDDLTNWSDLGMTSTYGSAPVVVSNVVTLKSLPASSVVNNAIVITRGYYTLGDSGSASYRYDSTSTATADDGSVILPNHGVGRYLLIPGSSVNVAQWGAKGDASVGWIRNVAGSPTPTDDTLPIQRAINYAAVNGIKLMLPRGNFYITAQLTNGTPTGVSIEGASQSLSLSAQYNAGVSVPQSSIVRNGNHSIFLFHGPLDAASLTNGSYVFNGQQFVSLRNLLIQDANRGTTITTPAVVMKRSLFSRWDNVSFIGIQSTAMDLYTADDAIFNDCRWMSCGYQTGANMIIHRSITVGSEPTYVANNTMTFIGCNWESSYNTAIQVPSTDTSGDVSTLLFSACTIKNADYIQPKSLLDLTRASNVRFQNLDVVHDPAGAGTNSLDAIVKLNSCQVVGTLNVIQINVNAYSALTNAVLITDSRDSDYKINVSSPSAATIVGDTLIKVVNTDASRNRISVSGRSYVNDSVVEYGAYGNKPISNWPDRSEMKSGNDWNTAALNGSQFIPVSLNSQDISTNDFTISAIVEVPKRYDASYGIWMLSDSTASPPAVSNSSLALYWSLGVLKLRYVDSSGTAKLLSLDSAALMRGFAGERMPLYVVRSGGSLKVWAGTSLLSMSGTQINTADAISSTASLVVGYANDGTAMYSRQGIQAVEMFNYAFDSAGIARHLISGTDTVDFNASVTPVFVATFDSSVESFFAEGTANFVTNALGQAILMLGGSGSSGAARTTSVNGIANTKYKININIKTDTGGATPIYVGFASSSFFDSTTNSTISFTPTSIAQWFSGIVGRDLQNPGALRIRSLTSNYSGYVIDGITIVKLGRIANYEKNSTTIVNNVSDLKYLPVLANNSIVVTRGYYSNNDGGESTYRYDTTSTATANDGNVILPNHGVGRYILIPGSRVNLLAFGIKLGDASEGSNNAVRITTAITTYKDGGHLLLPASQNKLYLGPNPVRPATQVTNLNIELHGKIEVPSTPVWSFSSPGSLFHFADSGSYNNLRIFGTASIYGNATNQATTLANNYGKLNCFKVVGSTNLAIDGLNISGFGFMAVQINACDGVRIADLTIDQTVGNNDTYPTRWGANADGVHVYDSRNVIIKNCNIQSTDDCISLTQGSAGIISTNYIVTGNVLRPYAGTTNLVPAGIRIGMEPSITTSRIEDVIISDNIIKPVGANGIYIGILATNVPRSMSRIKISNTIITGAGESGTVQIGPNAGQTIQPNILTTGGMYVANASDVTLNNVQISNSRGKGISIANVGKFSINGSSISNIIDSVNGSTPRGAGIYLATGVYGNTDDVSITDSSFSGLDGGGIYADASNFEVSRMRVVGCQFNNWLRGLYASGGRTYAAIVGSRCLTNYISGNDFINGEGSCILINAYSSLSEHEIRNNSFPFLIKSSGSTVGATEMINMSMTGTATGSRVIVSGNRFGEWAYRAMSFTRPSELYITGNFFLPKSLASTVDSTAIGINYLDNSSGTSIVISGNNIVNVVSKGGSNPSSFIRTFGGTNSTVALTAISSQNIISPGSGMAHLMDAYAGGARDLAYSANLAIPNSSEIPIRHRVDLTGDTKLTWDNPSPGQRGVLDVYPDSVNRLITLPTAYSPTGTNITIVAGSSSTNWTRLMWEVHQVGGTNRILVSPTQVYR